MVFPTVDLLDFYLVVENLDFIGSAELDFSHFFITLNINLVVLSFLGRDTFSYGKFSSSSLYLIDCSR